MSPSQVPCSAKFLRSKSFGAWHRWHGFAWLAAAGVLAALPAEAHFNLQAPASFDNQDSLGNPQKSAPCGQADPGTPMVASGQVTTFHPGDKVTITFNETVYHPGHYRVALAVNDTSELPADPPVTAGSMACGTTVIQSPATFPTLADGMLAHTSAFTGAQSFQVTLPSNVTCAHCTLQVVEFMSEHGLNNPGGCFYHHCANIAITAGGQGAGGGTSSAGASAGGAIASGGISASGGATSSGGTASSAGGAASGGAQAGGAASSSGGAGGKVSSAGGAAAGGAAAGGATSTSGGADAGGVEATPSSDSGCGCHVLPQATSPGWAGIAIALGVGAFRRRRRRS